MQPGCLSLKAEDGEEGWHGEAECVGGDGGGGGGGVNNRTDGGRGQQCG